MAFSELLAEYGYGLLSSAAAHGASPAIALVVLICGGYLMKRGSKSLNDEKDYPSYLPSAKYKGREAGYIETTAAMTGSRAPQFLYESITALPPSKTWIGRLRMPTPRETHPAVIAVADIGIARAILTDPLTIKPPGYEEFDFIAGAPNIVSFSTNGIKWKHARKGVAPAFSSNHVKRMNRICLERFERWRQEVLDPCAECGEAIDIGKEMLHLTLGVIAQAGFEYEMSREEMDLFLEAFETSSREFIMWNPIHRWFQFLFHQVWRAKRASRTLQSLAFKIMKSFRASDKGKKGRTNEYADDTIISRIINNQNYANDVERAADIVIVLVAGHDTTAFSIAWALIEVARSKDKSFLTGYRTAATATDSEGLRRLDQLQYIIKESMQLRPVLAIGSARQIGKTFDFRDKDGSHIRLPKNSVVFTIHYAMFRNPTYFGNDADSFRPNRWKDESNSDQKMQQTALIPFAVGPRNCVGQALANAEMTTVLSILLAQYDFSIAGEQDEEFFMTLKPKGTKLTARKLK
mmetsp:Transcript_36995/g.78130  ORF Transcript_36995/g.78130 Transcript_36995/m.78130 type:complete len:521 (+) Transcript_36995:432-1994(+)|eukprot:CAMPEP_0183712618 /NCGR_PEP_ID=MMETSP0737-20130205/7704_1 /TAXON_ID=385413 /ORGANISM="Thalassiosira miniscula, Strain CCMP1093" /LENGTH=520 /DNA_ID=CAMNT_0025941273 /DNA_START=269 /DNA_END=1831 /DNA_ORIENTATION=+